MYAYFLPNGVRIDDERILEIALEEGPYPAAFIDRETGALVELATPDGLELWTREHGASGRYVRIEPLPDAARDAAMKAFAADGMKGTGVRSVLEVRRALSRGGWRAAEGELAERGDEWLATWDDFLEDEAWIHVHAWLVEHPTLEIEAVFEGCGHCEVCALILKDAQEGVEADPKKLREAYATEDVMHSVALQLAARTRGKGADTKAMWAGILERMHKIKIEHHTLSGGMWAAAWLFTIGYLQLAFWQGVLAIAIWPYYLGLYFAGA